MSMPACAIQTRPWSARRKGSRLFGFSLIELLVVLGIVGLLASVVVPVAQMAVQRQREQTLTRHLFEIRQALDAYKRAVDQGRIARPAGSSGYPPSLQVLVDGVVDLKDPQGRLLRFLRRIPGDPMTARTDAAGNGAWGLRSHASDANNPRPGADVFDVHSSSAAVGLNGVPYADW
ncbi:MAG: type II secretion system protein [Aquabacterium sp.]|nr:type II secretion system protein [Aquabacterium sp.]